MPKKIQTNPTVKPDASFYADIHAGRLNYTPLEHKDGKPFDDIDYMELLGRKCLEDEAKAGEYGTPAYTGKYDPTTVQVAKTIVKAIDEKIPRTQIQSYLSQCIDISA